MSNTLSPLAEINHSQEVLGPFDRVRLGGDEMAVCGLIDLSPGNIGEGPDVRLVLLDVGFRNTDNKYGPYDIDGSGVTRSFDKPYVLVAQHTSPDGEVSKTFTYNFDENEQVILGRDPIHGTADSLGFANNPRVSRQHARIHINQGGGVVVEDLASKNGTISKSAVELVGALNTTYGYTQRVSDFVHQAGRGNGYKGREEVNGWGYGEYEGRPIIARDTPINTGVYPVGGTGGEALVVDDIKYPKELNAVYETVIQSLDYVQPSRLSLNGIRNVLKAKINPNKPTLEQSVLGNVLGAVTETLKYDLQATDALGGNYQKISLNTYINKGVGVCRTQAILVAYLVERLIKDGKLEGAISIDRNEDHAVRGGHAWARFRSNDGKVYIVDPAQQYVGTIEDTYDDTNTWNYQRSEDIVQHLLSGRFEQMAA